MSTVIFIVALVLGWGFLIGSLAFMEGQVRGHKKGMDFVASIHKTSG